MRLIKMNVVCLNEVSKNEYILDTLIWERICVKIQINGRFSLLHIGAWAYKKRSKKRTRNNSFLLDERSFIKERVLIIKSYFHYILNSYITGKRPASIRSQYCEILEFINWCDDFDAELSHQNLQFHMISYTDFLLSKVHINKINVNTASRLQVVVAEFLSHHFSINVIQLMEGIVSIRKENSSIQSIEVPSNEDIAFSLKITDALFEKITDFLLKNEPYPFLIEVGHLAIYMTSAPRSIVSNKLLFSRKDWSSGCWSWNFEELRIHNPEEILQHYNSVSNVNSILKQSWKALERANNSHSFVRLKQGRLAANSFAFMFMLNTGVNLAVIQQLRWSDEFEIGSERHGFKAIKYRANGRNYKFEITNKFLPKFKTYLKLRKYLLCSSEKSPLLFFTLNLNVKPYTYKPASSFLIKGLITSIRKSIEPSFPNITCRQLRAFKQNSFIYNNGIEVAAKAMQHSKETAIKSYSNGTLLKQQQELSNFFNTLNEQVFINDKTHAQSIVVGSCNKFNNPSEITLLNSPIKPNCSEPEGCLFCDKYRLIDNDESIRKLASVKYIIISSKYKAQSIEHFEQVYLEVLNRIDDLLDQIKMSSFDSGKKVDEVVNDVFTNENLTLYWSNKLEMMQALGAI